MSKCEICDSDLPHPDASGYQREHIVERCRDVLRAENKQLREERLLMRAELLRTNPIWLAKFDGALDAVRGRAK